MIAPTATAVTPQPPGRIGVAITPDETLHYLEALGAWRDRDGMLGRMQRSTLFTHDLAGECLAAARVWGIGPGEKVEWRIGVVEAPASEVRRALASVRQGTTAKTPGPTR